MINECGDFIGVLSMTDILESIAGELPDATVHAGFQGGGATGVTA